MKNNNSRSIALLAWTVASLFYAFQYILRVIPNIIVEDILIHFNINTTIFGQFSGIYYIGYSLMHLPIGIMLDRFGARKIIFGSILLSVLGLIPLIISDNWLFSVIGRMITGMGSSGAALGMLNIIRLNFSDKKYTRMLSFSMTIGLIGAIYGGGPVSYMCSKIGYVSVLKIFTVVGIGLALISYFLIPNNKNEHKSSVFSDLKTVFLNKKIIWVCIFSGLMVGPLEGFADAWGVEFLKKVYNFNSITSANLCSMIFVGMCFGCPLLAYIAEKTNYLRSVVWSGVLMTIAFTALITGSLNQNIITISFIVTGVCCSYQILVLYKVSTYVNKNISGLATAAANMIVMSFGYAFHSIIGYIIDISGGLENPKSLISGISIIPVTLTIGFIGFIIFIKKLDNSK